MYGVRFVCLLIDEVILIDNLVLVGCNWLIGCDVFGLYYCMSDRFSDDWSFVVVLCFLNRFWDYFVLFVYFCDGFVCSLIVCLFFIVSFYYRFLDCNLFSLFGGFDDWFFDCDLVFVIFGCLNWFIFGDFVIFFDLFCFYLIVCDWLIDIVGLFNDLICLIVVLFVGEYCRIYEYCYCK